MNTRFINWAFASCGTSSFSGGRTQPNRLNDVINVKDWGALGLGADEHTNIQNAIDYCISQGGGTVFFPPGGYSVGGNVLTIGSNSSTPRVQLVGTGFGNCSIGGNPTGYIFGSTATYDNINRIQGLKITNSNTSTNSGAIRLTGECVSVSNCNLTAFVCCDASQANGALIADCQLGGTDSPQGSASSYPFALSGVAVYLGNQCTALNCRGTGSQHIGFALSGTGAGVFGCAYEVVTYGVRVGWGPSGETPAYACTVQSFQTEQSFNGIDLYNCQGGFIIGPYLNNTVGYPPSQTITNLTWDSTNHLVTATTSSPHFISSDSRIDFQLPATDLGYATGFWRETGYTVVTPASSNTFTYAGPATDPGAFSGAVTSLSYSSGVVTVGMTTTKAARVNNVITLSSDLDPIWGGPSVIVTGSSLSYFEYSFTPSSAPSAYPGGSSWRYSAEWRYPLQFGMRCRVVSETVIQGGWGGNLGFAAIDLDYNGEAQHRNNILLGLSGDTAGWNLPTNRSNLSGWQFLYCGSTGVVSPNINTLASSVPNPFEYLTFADLPGNFTPPFGSTSIFQDGPIEGQEYSIIDSSVTSSGNFAAIISTGMGTDHVKVRYDGTNWRISG